jgi:hypothetical protein
MGDLNGELAVSCQLTGRFMARKMAQSSSAIAILMLGINP